MRLLWLAVLILAVIVLDDAHGAIQVSPRTSQTNPGVQFKTKYGYLNATNSQLYSNMITVYSNGTIYLDVAGVEQTQVVYAFVALSYGNGSFVLRFHGSQPGTVTQTSATTTYSFTSLWEQITYSTNQNSALILVYQSIRQQVNNTVFAMASIFSLVGLVTGLFWIRLEMEGFKKNHVVGMDKRKDLLKALTIFAVGLAVIFAFVALFS